MGRKYEVRKYTKGENEFLDKVYEGELVFFVNGSLGRLPVLNAGTEEEAVRLYKERERGPQPLNV